jgi:hypothetical protein
MVLPPPPQQQQAARPHLEDLFVFGFKPRRQRLHLVARRHQESRVILL